MKHKLLLIILLFNCTICLSQGELAKKGIITLAGNQKITFNNVRLENGKFVFLDVKTGQESSLAINEVKYIEDENTSKVFTNKTVVDKSREADLKYEAEQKKLAIEEARRKEAELKKKLEDEKKALAFGIYPNGVYFTKEDFLNRKASNSSYELIAKEIDGVERERIYGIPDECFFYYLSNGKKIKDVFAVSYRGHLYFQVNAVLKNRNKTDRAQDNDHPNSFIIVKSYGTNYYYFEADLANIWAQGASVGAFGIIIGSAVASTLDNLKGIVWDIKNKEFNIFKNCSDYNAFIKDKYPEGVLDCKKQQPDIIQVRKAIEKIKSV